VHLLVVNVDCNVLLLWTLQQSVMQLDCTYLHDVAVRNIVEQRGTD